MANTDDRQTTIRPNDASGRNNYYPHLFRLLHWLLIPSLVVLTLTGFSLHASSSPQWSLFGGVLPSFFWSGQVHLIHILAALVFAPAVIAASWVYLRNRPAYQRTHLVLLCGSLGLVVAGVLMMTWPAPAPVYSAARWVQFLVGLFVLPIGFLWHVWLGLTRRRRALVPAFHPWAQPRWIHLVGLAAVAVLSTCLILNGLPIHPPWRDLSVKRIAATDVETERLDELPWQDAEPLQIHLAGGLAFDGGRTQVTLRAMHDGRELFVLAEWDDPTEDRRDMPWARTADGWKRLAVNTNDESHYYEDKFSLVFPAEPDWWFNRFGCAFSCHVGGDPDYEHGKRAYGYKGCDHIVDVWHWKSTRTDPCGQVDDKYWAKVDFTAKDIGRHGDPKAKGTGYKTNISEDAARPGWLPRDAWASRYGIIPTEHAVAYESDEGAQILEKIPVGAVIPGIVASAAQEDRGDVLCTSRYEAGRWRLYIRRKLDTGHEGVDGRPTDAKFVPGQSIPFGCASFDNSSKRHAYGFSVCRLVLAE